MAEARLRIEVAGLPNVPDGEARNDGVSGSLVTLTSIGTGNTTHQLRLVSTTDLPPPALNQVNATTWDFTPSAGPGHVYFFELECGDGVNTEIRRRTYRIPTANLGLLVPAPMEAADPTASLFNNGAAIVDASHDNAGGNYFGWAPRAEQVFRRLDAFARGYDFLPANDATAWRLRQGAIDYIAVDTLAGTVSMDADVIVTGTLEVGGDLVITETDPAGGDLGGTYPNPTVVDLTIASEVQGSVLYFNGANWVQLPPGTSGNFLRTQGAGANPIWAAGVTDHGALTGLADDDHAQYALLAGRGTGQTLIGGVNASNDLTLQSTSSGTRGLVRSTDRFQADNGLTVVMPSSTVLFHVREAVINWLEFDVSTGEITIGDSLSTQDIIFETGALIFNATAGTSGQVLTSSGAGVTPAWTTPVTGVTDHGALTGLADDDHTQYALLAGRGGGQVLAGGTAASNPLTFRSTTHATRGPIGLETLTTADADVEVRYQGGDGTNQTRLRFVYDASADQLDVDFEQDTAGDNTFIGQNALVAVGRNGGNTTATRTAQMQLNTANNAGLLRTSRWHQTSDGAVEYSGTNISGWNWTNGGTFSVGTTTAFTQIDFIVSDNGTNRFRVREGSNNYIAVNTTNGSEAISLGNAISNPTLIWNGSGAWDVGGVGTAGQVLTSNGVGVAPSWEDAAGGGGTLDAAYDFGGAGAGRTITVSDGAMQLVHGDAGDTTYALDVHYNAVAFTGTPHGILVDWAAATSLNNAADVYGLHLIGETNAGAGDSVGVRISGWDVAVEAVGTVDVTGNITVSGTVDGVDVSAHDHSGAGQGGTIAHSSLSGLTAGDPHTQYALLAGRVGGQILAGGTAASDPLTLRSTTNATRGPINFETLSTSNVDVDIYYQGGDGTNQTRMRTFYDSSANTVTYTIEEDVAGNGSFAAVATPIFAFGGTTPQLRASTSDGTFDIMGNRIAGSTSADVRVGSSVTRTAGNMLIVRNNTVNRLTVGYSGQIDIIGGAISATGASAFLCTPADWTSQQAGVESIAVDWNLGHTVTHNSNTLIATNRDYLIRATSHAFGTAGGIIRDGATLAIAGPPAAGSNASITNPFSLWTQAGAVQFGSTQVADSDQEVRLAGGDGTNQLRARTYLDASADNSFYWAEQDTAGDHTYLLANHVWTYGRPNTGTTTAARNTTFQWYWSDGSTERVLELIAGPSRPSFRMPSASANGLTFVNAAGTTTLLTMDAQNNICTFSSGAGSTIIRGGTTTAMTIERGGAGSTAVLEIIGGSSRDTVIEFEDPSLSWWVGIDTSRTLNDFVFSTGGVLGTSDKLILGSDGSASAGSDSLLAAGNGVGTNQAGGHVVLRGGSPTGTGLNGMVVAGDLAATTALAREYVIASGDGTENVRTYLQQGSSGTIASLWQAAGNVARGSSDRTTFFEVGAPDGSEATGDDIDAWVSFAGHIATEAVGTRYLASIQLDSSAQALVYNAPQRSTDGGFTGAHLFEITDNLANSWRVEQGSTAYFNATTTNSAESATMGNTSCGQVHCLNEATGENSIRLASGSDADEGKWFRSRRLTTASGGGPTTAITVATTSGHAGLIKIEGTHRDDAAGGVSHTWVRYYNWENNAGTVTLTQSGTSHSIGDSTTADLTAVASGANIEVRCTHSATLALQWTVNAEYHRTPD